MKVGRNATVEIIAIPGGRMQFMVWEVIERRQWIDYHGLRVVAETLTPYWLWLFAELFETTLTRGYR